jgi:hypothetical protein
MQRAMRSTDECSQDDDPSPSPSPSQPPSLDAMDNVGPSLKTAGFRLAQAPFPVKAANHQSCCHIFTRQADKEKEEEQQQEEQEACALPVNGTSCWQAMYPQVGQQRGPGLPVLADWRSHHVVQQADVAAAAGWSCHMCTCSGHLHSATSTPPSC